METIPVYKRDGATSYTLGAFASIELLNARPGQARRVFIHPSFNDGAGLSALCKEKGVEMAVSAKAFRRIAQKENTYVAAVFNKYESPLEKSRPHIVLVNPSDMGNLGTIARIAAAFSIPDLAIIQPAADIFHPKCVRSSMGAIFRINHMLFESFDGYLALYGKRSLFPFMLDGRPMEGLVPADGPFSLIFGNEAAGLGKEFANIGTPLRIAQSPMADSLNLSVAVGIGAHYFACSCGLI